jgi:DNA-binding NarL/FixJ family response regulator
MHPSDIPTNERCIPNQRVLLVEDNHLHIQQITSAVNTRCPQSLLWPCQTGAEALALLVRSDLQFDLILVDIGLPDMSGLAVVEAAFKRQNQAPIMVITNIKAESNVINAIRAGAKGYILKSDSLESISQSIIDVLEGNYPISPAIARSVFKMVGSPETAQSNDEDHPLGLSPRETETLKYLSFGYSYAEVAELMGVKLSTVQSNIRIVYRKLEANSQMQAVAKARSAGLI